MFSGTTPNATAAWRRSSKCSMGSCVEVLLTDDWVFIRDSKQNDLGADQPLIPVDPPIWKSFLEEIHGVATVGSNGTLAVKFLDNGWVQLSDIHTGTSLSYDEEEWAAFTAGVTLGEMASPVAG